VTADLASLKSVAALADQVKMKAPVLDVLWNNAGGMTEQKKLSADGIEHQMAVNHLAPFALTGLLLPELEKADQGRVISTSSMAQIFVSGNLDSWFEDDGKKYQAFGVYSKTKLANVLFTQELASRLKGTKVTAHAFHPGFVHTGFGSGGDPKKRSMISFFALFLGLPPEKGADTGVFLATSPEAGKSTGLYWMKRKPAQANKAATPVNAKKLWDESQKLIEKVLGK
jgi:NAD(P)-dependent dehydrogenase (short-subunit alcohol dehydrogenase family)